MIYQEPISRHDKRTLYFRKMSRYVSRPTTTWALIPSQIWLCL